MKFVTLLHSKHVLDCLKISQFLVMVLSMCYTGKGGIFKKHHRLPDGCPPGWNDDHLRLLNPLHRFCHNSRAACFVNDQVKLNYLNILVTLHEEKYIDVFCCHLSCEISVTLSHFKHALDSLKISQFSVMINYPRAIQIKGAYFRNSRDCQMAVLLV